MTSPTSESRMRLGVTQRRQRDRLDPVPEPAPWLHGRRGGRRRTLR